MITKIYGNYNQKKHYKFVYSLTVKFKTIYKHLKIGVLKM